MTDQKKGAEIPASIIPNWSRTEKNKSNPSIQGFPASRLPFENEFWQSVAHSAAASQLDQVKGFITAFPIYWTKGENLRIKYPTPLIVDRGTPQDKEDESVKSAMNLASGPEYPRERNHVS